MSLPLVSVVVTAYNVGRFVGRAVQSALDQDHPAVEVIVVDDGSTDGTADVLAAYGDAVAVVRQANGGFIAAVDAGLVRATGAYIGLLDGDDEWPADRISRQLALLEAHPEVGLVHGDMELIDADGRQLAPSFFAAENVQVREGDVFGALLRGNFVSGGASLFRASFLDRLLPIPAEAAWPDWWIATRVAELAEIRTVPGTCNLYRQHGANMGLGADAPTFARRKAEEIRFRRWILRELADSRASVEDLLACFGALEVHAAQIGSIESRPLTSAVEPSPAEHEAAAVVYEEGLSAQRRGELDAAARSYLRALGHDPWHGAARAEAHFVAHLLGDEVRRRRPLPPPRPAHATATAPSGEPPLVSIVIPVFNRLELTRQCLEAIERTTPLPHETIVVDNASTDGTRELLLAGQADGQLRALVNEENLGFGRACNAGARLARGEYVLLLNNDTIPHEGWLDELVRTLEEDPSIGIAGSRLLYADGTIQHAGVTFTPSLMTEHVFRGFPGDHPIVLEPRDWPAVTGACILLRRSLWEELGGLDEGYRHYVEDIDLCMRVWAAGYRVRYCATSVVTHLEQQSAPDRAWVDELVEAGWRRFHARWGSRWPEAVKALSPVTLPEGSRSFAVVALADEVIRNPELLVAYAERFEAEDDATLIVYDPEHDAERLAELLLPALEAAGLAAEGPDMLALGRHPDVDVDLARGGRALLGRAAPAGPLAALPRFDERTLDELRAAAERCWTAAA